MYATVQSFIQDYTQESASTQRVFDALTDESLAQAVAPGYRTISQLAWHLAESGGMLSSAGFNLDRHSGRSESAVALAEAYRAISQSIIRSAGEVLTDEKLSEPLTVFGKPFTYGSLLGMFVKHEVHHRGQLTILIRQAGIQAPGVYGPSKEEWALNGMEAPQ
ncbi:DinB family protein [Paenibacillus radicis (ex Gao et al. 2016)]|uniref:Damage-inducible protein DinB n=1 Tax=Paenibacillus radicis (ex Gao et al. 2016) TaxID=1737354 RepID=A0A917M5I1_9BACL|nr:DinB family protein [Paenibacillus radicis (ex Gao et al. 2016)]GGG78500.1 hypothetical protein GCM10010918_39270 [Paenibacillus radicis (ex Gao et al. 2016)]